MPGRQSHGRPVLPAGAGRQRSSVGKSGKHKATTSRSRAAAKALDAFGIAAAEDDDRTGKGGKRTRISNRMRDLEPERPVRKQHQRDEEEEGDGDGEGGDDEGGSGRRRKRQKVDAEEGDAGSLDDFGSDSDGNEWHVGVQDEDEDSEIDSDEAFGESDEERFEGFAFGGSSSNKAKKKGGKAPKDALDEESDDEDEDDDQSLGEDAVDLADVLDEESGSDGGQSGSDEEGSDHGSSFSSQEDEDDDEQDELARLDELGSMLQAMPSGPSKTTGAAASGAPRGKITLADLGLGAVKDPLIKKSVKLLKKEEKATKPGQRQKLDVPLAKRQQDKLLRAAAYEKGKETLDRWTETVKRNRRADHLVFPLPQDIPSSGLDNSELLQLTSKTSKSVGSELQQTILSIMEESGLGPKPQQKPDDEEAGGSKQDAPPGPDLRTILAEKRIRREMESREQMRAKRIKKIKSKAYHRIHKRQRLKELAKLEEIEGQGGGDSEEEREAHDRRRAEERMKARHRESKWGKGSSKARRAAWDEEYRMSMAEHAQRTLGLRKRKEGRAEEGSDAEESVESDDDDEEAVRARLREELDEIEALAGQKKPTGIMGMKFMQRAEEEQRRLNEEAIAELRRDLDPDAEDTGSESEGGVVGRRTYGQHEQQPASAATSASKGKKRQSVLEQTILHSALQPSTEDTAEQTAKDKWAAPSKGSKKPDSKAAVSGETLDIEKALAIASIPAPSDTAAVGVATAAATTPAAAAAAAAAAAVAAPNNAKATKKPRNDATTTTTLLIANGGGDDSSDSDPDPSSTVLLSSAATSRIRIRNTAENVSLLARAFAEDMDEGDDHEHVAAQFAAEKAAVAAEDDDRVVDVTIPGWGSWTGPGLKANGGKPKRRFLQTIPGVKKKANRRDAKLERVIISEKRVKKNDKYLASQLPHPFESRQQYERSLRLPVGREWVTKETFQEATKPRVIVKQGIITPITRPVA